MAFDRRLIPVNRRAWFGFALALVSLLYGISIFRILAAFGPGLSVDSASYIGAARSFARGGELLVPYASWTSPSPTQPLRIFPPLLPIVLGFFERSGLDAVNFVRFQNAGLAAVTFFLALALVARRSRFDPTPSAMAACALVFLAMLGRSPGLLYLWAWSEPLFLLFFVLFLHALAFCRDRPERLERWALLGVVVGLASLTRYAGLSLLGAGWLAVLSRLRRSASIGRGGQIGLSLGAFLTGFGFLYAPWFLTLRGVARESGGLALPQLRSFIDQQLGFLGTCVLAHDAPPQAIRFAGLAILVALIVFLLGVILRVPDGEGRWTAITALSYLLFLAVAATFDRMGLSDVDGRYLAPFLLAAVLALGSWLASASTLPGRNDAESDADLPSPIARWFVVAVAGLFFASSIHRALPRVRQAATWGVGFERLPWRDSALLAWLRLHEGAYSALYSNQPAGLYFGTRRAAFLALSTGEADSAIAFRQKFESAPSLYVAFEDEIWAGQMPAAELAERVGLVRLETFPEGVVYGRAASH